MFRLAFSVLMAGSACAQQPNFFVPFQLPGGGMLNLSIPVPVPAQDVGQLAEGYDLVNYHGTPCRVSAADLPLRVYSTDPACQEITQKAANVWNRLGNYFQVVNAPVPGAIPIQWNCNLPEGAAGVTTMKKSSRGVRINGIAIQSLNIPEGSMTEVLAHEMGHCLGLDHSVNPQDLMYRSMHERPVFSGEDVRITQRDYQMLSWLYHQNETVPIMANR
ncbi:MAG: matrixin family metalloprotease [Vulcanimicrobiota bacterium]